MLQVDGSAPTDNFSGPYGILISKYEIKDLILSISVSQNSKTYVIKVVKSMQQLHKKCCNFVTRFLINFKLVADSTEKNESLKNSYCLT